MGLDNRVHTFGSATCKAENGSAKQPDCQFLSKRLPRARTKKWPSVVVETGFSESPSKLMSDARFWLSESSGDVQMVITIKIGRSSPHIVLEAWERVNDRIQRQQVVTISKGENNHVYLQNQPFTISSFHLFTKGRDWVCSFQHENLSYPGLRSQKRRKSAASGATIIGVTERLEKKSEIKEANHVRSSSRSSLKTIFLLLPILSIHRELLTKQLELQSW